MRQINQLDAAGSAMMNPFTNAHRAYEQRRKKLIFKACALRDDGLTYAAIGKRLGGFARSTVWGWIHRPDRHNPRGNA